MSEERKFEVRYWYATYSGCEVVWAEDRATAIAIAKRRLRRHMGLPMAYERWEAREL